MVAYIAIVFAVTLLLGVPIAFGLGLSGATWILFWEQLEPGILARRMYYAMNSFPLLAIPLFVMIGYLAEACGMLPELVRWLQLLLGRLRGGVAYINVVGSMLFAGVSGTAVSDVASLGRVEMQMMRQAGYPAPYSAALTAATSIAGPIIPPSVAMVIYALAAGGVSIGGLFMAGALPGLLLGLGMIALCAIKAMRGEYGTLVERPSPAELMRQTWRTLPILFLPVIIVGGIVGGIFTVTESAAIGVVYTLILGFVLTRTLRLRQIYDAVIYSAVVSSVLGMLMGAGVIVSWILTRNQITQALAEYLTGLTTDPMLFMAAAAILLLLLGMVMDATAIIIALGPLLAPVATAYGIDPLHFGLVFVLSCMIGLATPPVGIVLFMTSTVADVKLEIIARAIVPFILWMFAVVALVIVFPSLTVWLPRMVGF